MNENYPPVDGIVGIAHSIHAVNEQGLKNVLEYLSEDYDIKNCMEDKERPHPGYFASLKDSVVQHMTKCDFCNHLNSQRGCKCHGYRCANCQNVLWYEYQRGGTVRFCFREDNRARMVTLFIHSYDEERQMLYCYAKFVKSDRFSSLALEEQFDAHMLQHKNAFVEVLTSDKKKLLAFHYPNKGCLNDVTMINIAETRRAPNGNRCHYKEVSVYKGKEYPGGLFGYNLPARESYMVYHTQLLPRDSKLSHKIIQMAGQTGDCRYYSGYGLAYNETQLKWVALAVEHFTDLPIKEFREFLLICRLDGPGFIVHLADWIEKQTGVKQYVENKPDIKEFLLPNYKMFGAKYMTEEEKKATKLLQCKYQRYDMGVGYDMD